MKWLKRWKTQTLFLLAIIGPGFITANVDNDAGGIFTYSFAGAQFGYVPLFTIIPMALALIVVQEMSARMGAFTGKGLSDLIREEYGLRITFVMMLALVATNFTNVMAEFAGVASSMGLFRVPKFVSVPIAAAVVWLIVVKGNYKSVEKVFLTASFFYIAYIIAGVLARPNWNAAALSALKPPTEASFRVPGYVYMVTGIIGATIAPWMQFYLQASVVEKGVTERDYRTTRIDILVGSIFAVLVAAFIIIACAATLNKYGHPVIADAADAARALGPLAGKYAFLLFGAGLFNASLFAASILPLSTAYTVCEGLGFESGLDKKFGEAPFFYWLYTGLVAAGAAVILLPRFPLLKIPVLSQVLNGVLLPFVLLFMLLLINKPHLMGTHVNTKFFNWVAWVTAGSMIVLSVLLVFQ
ncbi:MAG TPA: Nramp family divalent metal transporter [Candidatus Angelobacter sp.]|nr:Nramp family divalent metal transporter [Candidatus Angelobacter sp.]